MNPIQRFLMYEEENIERNKRLRVQKKLLRDNSNPMDLPDQRFIQLFRLNKDLVQYLFENLQAVMDDSSRSTRLAPQLRILVALRFFATGQYQRGVGEEFLLSASQQSVSRCITEVAAVIVRYLGAEWVKFPQTGNEKLINKRNFMLHTGFPGCIAALDCTHVAILAPTEEEHNYINRKGYHSKNVQLICNFNLEILNVNARYPGSTHDAFIWRASNIKTLMENKYNEGERNTWLLGDSGYPQQPWLMTPVQRALPNTPEERYNSVHSRARNCIERCNGVLKNRFRCIMGERKLRYDPNKVGVIVNACCVLHNMCIKARVPFNAEIQLEEIAALNDPVLLPGENVVLDEGRRVRQQLINTYFQL